jgi:hypothetical protein
MILRIAAHTDVSYPIPQHRVFAHNVGINSEITEAIVQRDLHKLDEWTIELCKICEEITDNIILSDASLDKLVAHYGKNDATKAIWLMSWFNMLIRFVGSTRIPIEEGFNTQTSSITGPI